MWKRSLPVLMILALIGMLPGCFYSLGIGSGGLSVGGGGYYEGRNGNRGDDRGGRNGESGYERRGGESRGEEPR